MKRTIMLLLVILILVGCSRVRTETLRREDGTREAWAVSAEKIKSEREALNKSKDDCRRYSKEAAIISQNTIYQGRLTGRMKEQAELGGPLPPFSRSHQDFRSTVIYRCEE